MFADNESFSETREYRSDRYGSEMRDIRLVSFGQILSSSEPRTKRDECLTTLSLTVFTQRNFVADFLQVKCNFRRKTVVLRFRAPLRGLGATYDVHLRLIGKLAVHFLLVLIGLFARCYGWGTIRANIDWKSAYLLERGQFGQKFQVEAVVPHQPFLVSETKINVLSYGIKICSELFFRFVTIHAFDRRTDGRTVFSWIWYAVRCITCSRRVKTRTSYILPQCKTSIGNNSGSTWDRAESVTFARFMGFLDMAGRMMRPPFLSRDRKWPRLHAFA